MKSSMFQVPSSKLKRVKGSLSRHLTRNLELGTWNCRAEPGTRNPESF